MTPNPQRTTWPIENRPMRMILIRILLLAVFLFPAGFMVGCNNTTSTADPNAKADPKAPVKNPSGPPKMPTPPKDAPRK